MYKSTANVKLFRAFLHLTLFSITELSAYQIAAERIKTIYTVVVTNTEVEYAVLLY